MSTEQIILLGAFIAAVVGAPACWLALPLLGVGAAHVTGLVVALLGAAIVAAWMFVREAV